VIDPVQHFLDDARTLLRCEVGQRRFTTQGLLGFAQPAMRLCSIAEHVCRETVDTRQPQGFFGLFDCQRQASEGSPARWKISISVGPMHSDKSGLLSREASCTVEERRLSTRSMAAALPVMVWVVAGGSAAPTETQLLGLRCSA
jgi:hypothetical protein